MLIFFNKIETKISNLVGAFSREDYATFALIEGMEYNIGILEIEKRIEKNFKNGYLLEVDLNGEALIMTKESMELERNVFEIIHKSLLVNWTDKNYPLFL